MVEILRSIEGKKTYFAAFVGVILSGLWVQGYIDTHTYVFLVGLLGSFGFASLRHGITTATAPQLPTIPETPAPVTPTPEVAAPEAAPAETPASSESA